MSTMTIALEPWKRAFQIAGRSRRREYFVFYGQFFGAAILVGFVNGIMGGKSFDAMPAFLQIIFGLIVLCALVPGFTLHVRRLHDQNRSGWWMFINAIPFVGHLIMFIIMLLPGTVGDNRFGRDPRQLPTVAADFQGYP